MTISIVKWATTWQKDPRFSRNQTIKLLEKACRLDGVFDKAYRSGTMQVTAGPHRKSGPGAGGDARWHITVRPGAGEDSWHVILNANASGVVKVDKREHLGHRF